MTMTTTAPGTVPACHKSTTDAPRAAATSKSRPTVLVVDDEKDLVELISYNLQRNGYDVLTAGTGDAALDVAAAGPAEPGPAGPDAARA